MFDKNLLFTDAVAVTADGVSDIVNTWKTPESGCDVEIVVTVVAGTNPTLDVTVNESDDNFASENLVNTTFPRITAAGRYLRRVQSKKKALRLVYDIGGTGSPSFTVTAGVVSGPQRDHKA